LIEDTTKGQVLVVFEKMHTAQVGVFKGEFEVQFSDSRVETFPSQDYVKIKIITDIGGR